MVHFEKSKCDILCNFQTLWVRVGNWKVMETDFHLVCMSHDFAAVSFCWFLLWYAMVCVLQFFLWIANKVLESNNFLHLSRNARYAYTTHTTTKLHTYQACSLIHDFQREKFNFFSGIFKPKWTKQQLKLNKKKIIFNFKSKLDLYNILNVDFWHENSSSETKN